MNKKIKKGFKKIMSLVVIFALSFSNGQIAENKLSKVEAASETSKNNQSEISKVNERLKKMMNGSIYKGMYKLNIRYKGEYANEQCKGFSKSIHKKLFSYSIGSTQAKPNNYKININSSKTKTVASTTNIQKTTLKNIFSKARPGDFIQVRRSHGGSHSMIFISSDNTSVTVYECNLDNKNTIKRSNYSYSTFAKKNAGISIYTAKQYKLK